MVDALDEMVTDQEAGALLDQVAAPPLFVYAEDRITETVVREIALPGVRLPEPDPEYIEAEELPLGPFTLLEVDEYGQEMPPGTRPILEWARARAQRLAERGAVVDRATVIGTVALVAVPLVSAALGQAQLALTQAQLGAAALGAANLAWLWRGG